MCMSVCVYMPHVCRRRPLELRPQMVVAMYILRTEPKSSEKAAIPLRTEPIFSPVLGVAVI